MGFRIIDTAAPRLFVLQRVQLLSPCTDLNTLAWTYPRFERTLPPRNTSFRVRTLRHNGIAVTRPPKPFPLLWTYPASHLGELLHLCRCRSHRRHHTRRPQCFYPNSGSTSMGLRHAGGTGGHLYGPRQVRHIRKSGDLYGFPLYPTSHPAPLYKPKDPRPSTLSPAHAPIKRHNGPPRGETSIELYHYPSQNLDPHTHSG